MRRNRPRLVDTRDVARDLRRTFHATEPRRSEQLTFSWPAEMQVVGKCLGVVYSSDKWHQPGDWEDYKHLAEAPQFLLTVPDLIVDWHTNQPLETVGPHAELPDPMPRHFAKLAKFLGIQAQLYGSMRGQRGVLSRRAEDRLEIRIARAHLGGAVVPEDARYPTGIGLEPGCPFLFVYTLSDGVLCIVTGRQLDIEADGIVG